MSSKFYRNFHYVQLENNLRVYHFRDADFSVASRSEVIYNVVKTAKGTLTAIFLNRRFLCIRDANFIRYISMCFYKRDSFVVNIKYSNRN